MRLVSYNILEGGEGRADPLAEVIEAQNPDIVVLVEADHPAVVDRIAGRLKMDVIHAPGNEISSGALLSRWPIRDSINHGALRPKMSKVLLEATAIDPTGAPWTIGVVHLHAHATEADERRREQELTELLQAFAPHRQAGRPHLLAGDFNANSPVQQIDINRVKLATRQAIRANGGDVPRRVVQKLLDAGYIDSLQTYSPEQAASAGSFSTQYPGQRVDYIFAFGLDAWRLKSAWIERDRLARYASDHFPIGVELEATFSQTEQNRDPSLPPRPRLRGRGTG